MRDPRRGIYCNRTLNLHGIRAIGYDMDYTLVHYHMEVWERHAYGHLREGLLARGWPVADLEFDPNLVTRGLIIDRELGNVIKANRFGYVKQACHGTAFLDYETQRRLYARTVVDLRESRWHFLNTLFSISEGCMFVQLIDRVDSGALPGVGYADLFRLIRATLDEAHGEGLLKQEIIAAPERFVELDPETPIALLDQKDAGKQLVLITNSEWSYAAPILSFAFDRFLPAGMTWRDLFDLSLVGAQKPDFFSSRAPAFEVVSDEGLLREARSLRSGGIYTGGHAGLVEAALKLRGEQILYVGDHLFVDVNVSKSITRWRTALILRELEAEIAAESSFAPQRRRLAERMAQKERLEQELCETRLARQRLKKGREAPDAAALARLEDSIARLRAQTAELDLELAPLAQASSELSHARWGLLMRAGNDKSHLARQVERYADVYTSRVANFRAYTPFAYLRSPRGSLPHTPEV